MARGPIDIEDEKSGKDCDIMKMTALLVIASEANNSKVYAENRKEFQDRMVMCWHINLEIGSVSECVSQASVGLTGSAEILAGAGGGFKYLHKKGFYRKVCTEMCTRNKHNLIRN